jgi:hypothetical protein
MKYNIDIDIDVDIENRTIECLEKTTWKELYSKIRDIWCHDTELIKYPFPINWKYCNETRKNVEFVVVGSWTIINDVNLTDKIIEVNFE